MIIPLLEHLRANYQIAGEVDDGKELVVTTYAVIEPHTVAKMEAEGWRQVAPNALAWTYNIPPSVKLNVVGTKPKVEKPVKDIEDEEELVEDTPLDDSDVEE